MILDAGLHQVWWRAHSGAGGSGIHRRKSAEAFSNDTDTTKYNLR